MSSYIKNYGITKTIIKDNEHKLNHEVKWMGDYDGEIANIQFDINDNGSKEFVSMQLNNTDLMKLLGVQPIQMSLEERLSQDFLGKSYNSYKPITLEGALIKKKTRKHRQHHKKHYKRHRSPNSKKRRSYKI
jgi:hypothetical protein